MGEVEVSRLNMSYPAPLGVRTLVRRPPPREALCDVSFDIRAGELVALIGPNGAGKSSLLRILSGLLRPTSGFAHVCGLDVVKDRPRSRQVVGAALSEDRGFSPRLTGRQNLEFFGVLYGLSRARLSERLRALSSRFEAAALLDRPIRTLSTGERARLVMVRALLHAPKVLLLDEITRALDPGAAGRIRSQLQEEVRERNASALFASHDLAEVESLSARVVLLDRGRVAAFGPFREISAQADRIFRQGARA